MIGPELYCWVGLSTNPKPEAAYSGQRAFESDTGACYQWRGNLENGSWKLMTEIYGSWQKFLIEVQRGNVPGHSLMSKFAENPSILAATPADIWNYPAEDIYTFSSGADIDSISSDDNSDTIEMYVEGLDVNWDLTIQLITLTGQTRKALDTPLRRVYRVRNNNAALLVGNVYVYENTDLSGGAPIDTAKVRAYVSIAEQGTWMSAYTIPNGKTGFFLGLTASVTTVPSTTNGLVSGRIRLFGKVFISLIKFNLASTGSSNVQQGASSFSMFPGKTDFVARASVDTNGTGISVTFDILLIEDGY